MARLVRVLDRVIGAVVNGATWLALPMALLLFLQWPLREVVAQFSREANDVAQVLFALLVSVAITGATRARAHVAANAFASRYRPRTRQRLIRGASLLVLMPWSIFVLAFAWRSTVQSVLQFEGFPETFNPGYFMIRVALVLMALMVLAQAVVDIARPPPEDDP